MSTIRALTFFCLLLSLLLGGSTQQCGRQARGARCRNNLCCSQYGYCGTTAPYCCGGCQSNCRCDRTYLSDIISQSMHQEMFPYINGTCGLNAYDAFVAAAIEFPEFGNTGDNGIRKREIAAFFAQTTAGGGWLTGEDGPQYSKALWFWMTPQPPKPSPHDVITRSWKPTPADSDAGRVSGYGAITNIITGGLECGKGETGTAGSANVDRIRYYMKYCDLLGISYGHNLDCFYQKPFGSELLKFKDIV